jgi:hypothetical protein
LIELVVALSLGALVMSIVGAVFVASLSTWRRGRDVREVHAQASVLLDVMTRDIRGASQAPSISIRPPLAVEEGAPILAVASVGAGSHEAPWIVFVYRADHRDVVRYAAAPASDNRLSVKDRRIVANHIERVDVTPVGDGVTIEVEARRGRDSIVNRATAAPRNP